MKKLLLSALIFPALSAPAQIFWTENFGSGCSSGTVVNTYTGTNGPWALTTTGVNDNYADEWYVSAKANNTGTGNCATGCTNSNSRTLHIGNADLSSFGIPADSFCTYLTGVFCGSGICSSTNKRAESPTINCTGRANITISFIYLENGEGTGDDATLWYFNGSIWAQIDGLAKTTVCSPFGIWTAFSMQLPSSANNNPNVKIGFNWTNNNNGAGADPSFAVDDITLNSTATYVPPVVPYTADVQVYSAGKNIVVETQSSYKVISVNDILGKNVPITVNGNTIALNENKPGIYFVQLDVKGILITKKVLIQ